MARQQIEQDLLIEISKMAAEFHLLLFHCGDSRRSLGAGFPDLVIAGREGVIFAELKRPSGSVTSDQRLWGNYLAAAGETWVVWRPHDLANGTITRALESIAQHKQISLI